MEIDIIQNNLDFETLSGRRININQEKGETFANVKKRLISKYDGENDGEIGNNDEFYLLNSKSGLKFNDNEIINQSLIEKNEKSNSIILIRRKRYKSFVEYIINKSIKNKWIKWVIRILCISCSMLLIAALAQISFFLPNAKDVPVTFQTLGIFVISSLLGWKMGVSTIILYLLCGLIGAPFFTNQNHGIEYLKGNTTGYLLGFIVASFIVGYASELGSDRVYIFNWKSAILSMIIGNIAIYMIGIPFLASRIGWKNSFKFGLAPFLLGDFIKIIIATLLIPTIWKLVAYISNRRSEFKCIPLDSISSKSLF